jgi:RNA polymerase primary sigma factor
MTNKGTYDDVNIYELYKRDIGRYKPIDDEKTRELLKQYKNGTGKEKQSAKERIVGANQYYILSIANKFVHGNNLMDLIGEGNIGLMQAIENYDIESDAKFTTYAMYWIRKTIMYYLTIKEPLIMPKNGIKLATYVPKVCQEFWSKNCRQPTTEEIQKILLKKYNLTFSNKEDLAKNQSLSIDEKYESDEEGQEFMMEGSAYSNKTARCNTDNFAKRHDEKAVINQILSDLSERDVYIIKCIYGIGCEAKSMEDVANEVGVSNERVRQIAVNKVETLGYKYNSLKDCF